MIVALIFIIIIIVYIILSATWWWLFQGNAEPISFLEALGWLPILILRLIESFVEYLETWSW